MTTLCIPANSQLSWHGRSSSSHGPCIGPSSGIRLLKAYLEEHYQQKSTKPTEDTVKGVLKACQKSMTKVAVIWSKRATSWRFLDSYMMQYCVHNGQEMEQKHMKSAILTRPLTVDFESCWQRIWHLTDHFGHVTMISRTSIKHKTRIMGLFIRYILPLGGMKLSPSLTYAFRCIDCWCNLLWSCDCQDADAGTPTRALYRVRGIQKL